MEFYTANYNLYVNHFNLWYKVLAIFTDKSYANAYMMQNRMASVLKAEGNVIVLTDKNDKGAESV